MFIDNKVCRANNKSDAGIVQIYSDILYIVINKIPSDECLRVIMMWRSSLCYKPEDKISCDGEILQLFPNQPGTKLLTGRSCSVALETQSVYLLCALAPP